MNPRVLIVTICIALLMILGAGIWYTAKWNAWTQPWGAPGDEVFIDVEEGWTATRIGEFLHTNGVVQDTNFYKVMADFQGFGSKLKAGEYRCIGTQSPHEVLEMIALGRAYQHKITIPEGLTMPETAERFAAVGICSASDFIEAGGGVIYQDEGGGLESGTATSAGMEGFLFPDTYSLEKNTPADKVVRYMLNRFNTVVLELSDPIEQDKRWWLREDAGGAPALTALASLIEKEAKRDEDRALIASVFMNRIEKKMNLGCCATIHFALADWSRELTSDDLKIDHPYNTYVHKGLPPGPICSPGRASLEAAMKPAETDLLYFIATGDGKTEFTKTLDEHNALKRRLKAQR